MLEDLSKKNRIMNKQLRQGLQIIAFFLPFYIGPAFFVFGNNHKYELTLKIIGGIMMIVAILGTIFGLKKIIDSIFEKQ